MKANSIIIVGASSGIGHLVAELFIERGWRVGVAARRLDRLTELIENAPERVFAKAIDVNSENAGDDLHGLIKDMGGVDVVFNCAGIGFANPMLDIAKEDSIVATNCSGFTRIADAAFNYFAEKGGGHVAAITSVAATRGLGTAPAYSASKRFQASYLTALRQLSSIRHLNIDTTDIRPGFVDTDLLDHNVKYPMLMKPDRVAHKIVKAIIKRRRVKVINRRWALVVGLWRHIPNCLWVRLPIKL